MRWQSRRSKGDRWSQRTLSEFWLELIDHVDRVLADAHAADDALIEPIVKPHNRGVGPVWVNAN